MDRFIAYLLFIAALVAGAAASLLLVVGFVDWLQTDSWHSPSVWQFGYDTYLIRAKWFLAYQWSWPVHEVLAIVPLYAALLVFAPVSFWCSSLLSKR